MISPRHGADLFAASGGWVGGDQVGQPVGVGCTFRGRAPWWSGAHLLGCGTLSRRLVPLSLAIASAIAFGTAGPLAKPLIDAGLSPLAVAWLRSSGAAVVLLPVAVRNAHVLRTTPALIVGYGLFAIAGVQAAYFAAVSRLPVAVALLVEYLAPVMVLLVARFVLGRRLSRASVVGAGVTIVGLAGVVEVWKGLQFDALGLLLALLAAVCLASYFLLSERAASVNPAALLAWGLLIGTAVLTLVARPWVAQWSVLPEQVDLAGWRPSGTVLALALVLVGTVVAYLTGIAAVRRLSAPIAAVVASLEAVVATALAWVLLGEAMSPVQIGGGIIVMVGAALAQMSPAVAGSGDSVNPVEAVPAPPGAERA